MNIRTNEMENENQEPLVIRINGNELELTPYNTAIVRYIARYAIHNHVRISLGQRDGYIFRECEGSDQLNNVLEDRLFPMASYVPEPTEEVIQQHHDMLMAMRGDEDIDQEVEQWRRLFEN